MRAFILLYVLTGCLAMPVAADLKIVVSKQERVLDVFCGGERIHRFPVGLGPNPEGQKNREGDGRTPEGLFRVVVRNPNSKYHLSLGIDYPDPAAARRGLEAGRISRREHDEILAARREGRRPPWNTALGGEIFIHGHGAHRDWTLGCVALENKDMEILFELVKPGTSVEIKP